MMKWKGAVQGTPGTLRPTKLLAHLATHHNLQQTNTVTAARSQSTLILRNNVSIFTHLSEQLVTIE